MTCRLLQNIKHVEGYNAGGVKAIYLLDIRSFLSYRFQSDKLYDECMVETVRMSCDDYIEMDAISTSNFTESFDKGMYKQQLTSFVRSLTHKTTSDLLKARSNKYLIIFETKDGKAYTFGSDGGASVSFSQQSGQEGESTGYAITIDKASIYPLVEIDMKNKEKISGVFDYTFNEKFN